MYDLNIYTHTIIALTAVPLGMLMLVRKKGTPQHKLLGRIWVGLMLIVSVSGFFIRELTGGFSWIHLLSLWTIISLCCAVWAIRHRYKITHQGFMIGVYIGLLVAGFFALLRHI